MIKPIKTITILLLPWTPHIVTASGLVFAFLTIIALLNSGWKLALIWMAAGVATDSVDGTMARYLNSTQKLPKFNGQLLDAIVDYVTYVIVPVLFIHIANLIPSIYNNWLLPLVLVSSSYQFAQTNAKTPDNYFTGFPSYWNIAVFYMLVIKSAPIANVILLLVLVVFIFIPIKYYYPSRTQRNRILVMTITIIWGIAGLILISMYPTIHPIPLWTSILCSTYYIYLSISYSISNRLTNNEP
jgi:phosphatidylcholine synthase